MAYSIEKFAHFLVMQYSNLNYIDPYVVKSLGNFKKDEFTKHIYNSIDLLLNSYKKFTDEITIENFEKFAYEIRPNKEEYVQHLLSKCLKLSEGNPTFFEFLLVCVYICKMTECLFAKYKCCKILKLAANSLEAVYFREYSKYFDKSSGFSGLADFCRSLNNCPPSVRYEIGEDETMTCFTVLKPDRNVKVKKLKCLYDVDDKVALNTKEKKFLVDKPYFIASNCSTDFLIDWVPRPVSPDEEDISEIIKDWDVVSEKVHKTDVCCDYCYSKCFQYPKDISEDVSRKQEV